MDIKKIEEIIGIALGHTSALFMSQKCMASEIVMLTEELLKIRDGVVEEIKKEQEQDGNTFEVTLAEKGTLLAEFQKLRTDAISEMFDNVYENGIYPTGVFFAKLDDWVKQVLQKADSLCEDDFYYVTGAKRPETRGKFNTNTHIKKMSDSLVSHIVENKEHDG